MAGQAGRVGKEPAPVLRAPQAEPRLPEVESRLWVRQPPVVLVPEPPPPFRLEPRFSAFVHRIADKAPCRSSPKTAV